MFLEREVSSFQLIITIPQMLLISNGCISHINYLIMSQTTRTFDEKQNWGSPSRSSLMLIEAPIISPFFTPVEH